jgi:hypothetical protein
MKAILQVEVKEFAVPNFVSVVQAPGYREEGFNPTTGIPLKELDASTLDQLCRNFRRAVFAKAELQDPEDKQPMPG